MSSDVMEGNGSLLNMMCKSSMARKNCHTGSDLLILQRHHADVYCLRAMFNSRAGNARMKKCGVECGNM